MRLRLLKPALDELREAYDYYESQRTGLGAEFAREIGSTIERIIDDPQAWSRVDDHIRRCRTHRFQYGVLYRVESDELQIVAIMHLRRRPGYWQGR